MSAVSLPSVDEAVEKGLKLLATAGTRLVLTGAFGAGKRTALGRIEARLREAGEPVVHVRFPWGDDAACAAVADLCDQSGQPTAIRGPRPLLSALEESLRRLPSDAVLFIEAPRPPRVEDTLFDERSAQCVSRLLDWGREKRVVLAQRSRGNVLAEVTEVHVARAADPREVLEKAGLLREPAVQALLARRETDLRRCSPIEIRLAAVVARADEKAVLRAPLLLDELLDRASPQVTPALRRALARLSLIRLPLAESWVQSEEAALSEAERQLLRQVFLFREQDQPRLHESVAIAARGWLSRTETEAAHRAIAQHYRTAFETAAAGQALSTALRNDVECVHHRTLGADPTLLDDSLFFVEQYDALGRAFGLRGQQLWATDRREARKSMQRAISAYDRALEHDRDDWYALHYRAFNRDALGGDVKLIGPDYARVINELKPDFAWGHSRYIRWLITCGRLREARVAFGLALRELLPDRRDDSGLYETLHIDVARQALENGQHELAREVLEQIPEVHRERLNRFTALVDWADLQKEIADGEIVFPPSVPASMRWAGSQFAAPGEAVEQFWPGVVTAQSGDVWRFRVAFKDGDFGWREVTREELKALSFDPATKPLPVGRFVEFLIVAGRERLEVHPQLLQDPFERHRVKFPDPRRYLTNDEA